MNNTKYRKYCIEWQFPKTEPFSNGYSIPVGFDTLEEVKLVIKRITEQGCTNITVWRQVDAKELE